MNKPLSKLDEIEILQHCAAKLGPESYCGPWLSAAIPIILDDIRSDHLPHPPTIAETMRACEAITAEARRYRDQVAKEADAYASKTIAAARKTADEVIAQACRHLNTAYNSLLT
jgi:regulator of protease activity HflC (stomatin/prohibitin superfamily)